MRRAERVYGEGGTIKEYADAYAHAQDNVRKTTGGNESNNYYGCGSLVDFDVRNVGGNYSVWNNSRGIGYESIEGLNKLAGANNAIAAEAGLLMGKTNDPINGADQWRGTKVMFDLVKKYYNSQEMVPPGVLSVKNFGFYVTNATFKQNGSMYHVFFNFSNKPEEKKQTQQYQWSSGSGESKAVPINSDIKKY